MAWGWGARRGLAWLNGGGRGLRWPGWANKGTAFAALRGSGRCNLGLEEAVASVMQRGDLGFIASRLLGVLLAMEGGRYLLAMIMTIGTVPPDKASLPSLIAEGLVCAGLLAGSWFLWFCAERFAGPKTRGRIEISDPVEFRRMLFAAVGLYFLVSGGAVLLQDVWWDVISKSDLAVMFRRRTAYIDEGVRAIVGFLLLLMNGSRIGNR